MTFEFTIKNYGPHFVLSKDFCRLSFLIPGKRPPFCVFNYYKSPERWRGPKWGVYLFGKRYDAR